MKDNPNALTDALLLATRAHKGQKYSGQDYIEHPVRVAERFDSLLLKVVALLHDVVEDSSTTVFEIHNQFGPTIANAVEALTRGDETYNDYIENKVSQNYLAVEVKIGDLLDHLDYIERFPDLGFASLKPRYEKALRTLGHDKT